MPSSHPAQRFAEMLENIERIKSYVRGKTVDDYHADTMVQDAVERCFERIAEAARKIGDGFDTDYPDAEFAKLRNFGSVLRHDYDRINPQLMWVFTQHRIVQLETAVQRILVELDGGPG